MATKKPRAPRLRDLVGAGQKSGPPGDRLCFHPQHAHRWSDDPEHPRHIFSLRVGVHQKFPERPYDHHISPIGYIDCWLQENGHVDVYWAENEQAEYRRVEMTGRQFKAVRAMTLMALVEAEVAHQMSEPPEPAHVGKRFPGPVH